jgi:hypothetical protein
MISSLLNPDFLLLHPLRLYFLLALVIFLSSLALVQVLASRREGEGLNVFLDFFLPWHFLFFFLWNFGTGKVSFWDSFYYPFPAYFFGLGYVVGIVSRKNGLRFIDPCFSWIYSGL